jgi:superoxide dismutase, Fe-Mn family
MFILPKLPYGYAALAPTISANTLHTHHDKHHRTYVETTNKLATQAGLAGRPLEEVIREAHRQNDRQLFHNAAQAWNHAFYWDSMAPRSGWPPIALRAALDRSFGDLDGFKDAFVEEGAAHFGSGWAWLVMG